MEQLEENQVQHEAVVGAGDRDSHVESHQGLPGAHEAARQASPAILEPMMAVEVTTPEDYLGDVIGDLNSRRGQIQAMEERFGARVVKALVPLSEMFGYVGDLRSKTSGRASYSMQFDSYAEVPRNIAEEIVKKARGE